MSVKDMRIASDLKKAFTDTVKKPSPYDTDATVTRVEGDTAWVHIPGGVDETPVQMSINVSEGDAVKVHVGSTGAWITGNFTAPPTADTAQGAASSAQEAAEAAQEAADRAEGKAEDAQEAAEAAQEAADRAEGKAEDAQEDADAAMAEAESVKNYFFHDSAGAHVASSPGDSEAEQNVLITSSDVEIRSGSDVRAKFEDTGVTFIDQSGVEVSIGSNADESGVGSAAVISAEDTIDLEAPNAIILHATQLYLQSISMIDSEDALIKTGAASKSVTVAAKSANSVKITKTITNYTNLGILEVHNDAASRLAITNINHLTEGGANITLYNRASSSVTATITVKFLFAMSGIC
jgi:hypothetical protein